MESRILTGNKSQGLHSQSSYSSGRDESSKQLGNPGSGFGHVQRVEGKRAREHQERPLG